MLDFSYITVTPVAIQTVLKSSWRWELVAWISSSSSHITAVQLCKKYVNWCWCNMKTYKCTYKDLDRWNGSTFENGQKKKNTGKIIDFNLFLLLALCICTYWNIYHRTNLWYSVLIVHVAQYEEHQTCNLVQVKAML